MAVLLINKPYSNSIIRFSVLLIENIIAYFNFNPDALVVICENIFKWMQQHFFLGKDVTLIGDRNTVWYEKNMRHWLFFL